MILLDANYILRFILNDNNEMYETSKECISNNNCTVPNEVLAEVVFVLLKVYKVSKEDITATLVAFLKFDNIIVLDKECMIIALMIFSDKNLDFVDSILCAKSTKYNVKTFDKKLNKCIKGYSTCKDKI
jgi:predicted nucleic-acid-binding protein